jgi:2-methylisocitrate lyase-like PEP mutase family enzyme
MSIGSTLKKMINSSELLLLPGVYDGLSANLVSQYNYKAAFITGAGISESLLGRPDVGIMGLSENLMVSRNIADSTDLLLIADADTGYGNSVNVYYTVKSFEKAGVAGVMIEDQKWPKRCGHMTGKEVISSGEMIEKIHAAVDAKVDKDFVIVARTDSAKTHGIEEAIKRANLYAEAGADLVFPDALLSKDDIKAFTQNVNAPVMLNMGFGLRERTTTPLCSPAELKEYGVSVVIYPRMLTSAAVKGMMNVLSEFNRVKDEKRLNTSPELLVSFDELQGILNLNNILEMQSKYSLNDKGVTNSD